MDPATAGRGGRRLPPEHQLDRAQPLRSESGAGVDVCARVRLRYRRHFHAGDPIVSFFTKTIDERFLTHRRRSTSIAGIAGGYVAVLLFAYRFYIEHIWSWDFLSVAITIAVVKVSLMILYSLTD